MVYLASTWCTVHNAGGSWYIGRHIAVLKSHNFFNILQIKQDKLRCQRIICTKLKINTFIVLVSNPESFTIITRSSRIRVLYIYK